MRRGGARNPAVATLNPQPDLDLADEYDSQGVPTLVPFEEGAVVGRMANGFEGTESVVSFVTESSAPKRQ